MTKILHLTLMKKWFDLIASGKKTEEYRDIKPYWQKRLNKDYDVIHFRNGYNKNCPFMIVEYKGKTLKNHNGKKCFAIKLGKILEIKNYKIN